MAGALPGKMRIGDVLRDARERAGLGLRDAEDQTKIRTRYLQALEDERWDELPSPAYAKGFLRTYASFLGLDAEALVDEFRRQVEGGGADPAYPLGDRVLEGRRRPGQSSGRRVPTPLVAIALVILVIGGIVAIGLLTGDDETDPPAEGPRTGAEQARGDGGGGAADGGGPVTVSLEVRRPVEVCLIGGGDEALIDRQVLAAGSEDEFSRRSFELRFPAGITPRQLRLEVDGKERELARSRGPAAYEIVAPGRVQTIKPPVKESCP